jgi:hypothetical protein
MTYAFDRTKIPGTLAFPLKRSVVDGALQGAGVERLAVLYFSMRQRGDIVMRAIFNGEHKKGAQGAGKATLHLYAVPSAERRSTEAALVNGALAQVCAWLRRSELEGNTWREADHVLEVHCAAGKVTFSES